MNKYIYGYNPQEVEQSFLLEKSSLSPFLFAFLFGFFFLKSCFC